MKGKKQERSTEQILNSAMKLIFGLASLWLVGVLIAYLLAFHNYSIGDPEAWGIMGDYFGGMLNPVIALAALVALLISIRIQQSELTETRKQLKDGQGMAYATSLIPLIEASRNELIAMMQSEFKLKFLNPDSGKEETQMANRCFRDFRFIADALNFNKASPATLGFIQRMTDRLFSIYCFCAEIAEKTNRDNVSNHYLLVVGYLILDLQSAGAIVTPSYSDRSGYESLINWAQQVQPNKDQPEDTIVE